MATLLDPGQIITAVVSGLLAYRPLGLPFRLGMIRALGSDGTLAVFVAGRAFNRVASGDPETERIDATDTLEHLLTVPAFLLFGTYLPWREWLALRWTDVTLAVAVLLLRRLPVTFALRRFVRRLRRDDDRGTKLYGRKTGRRSGG